MRTVFSVLTFFSVAVVLWGCPYKSDVGIDDKPSIVINQSLLGTWHKQIFPFDSTELVFKKLSGKKYGIEAKLPDGQSGYDSYHYEAWFSKINDLNLLSFYDTDSKKYSFAEVIFPGKQLTIKMLSEDITTEQFKTTEAMKNFVEDIYLHHKVIYDKDTDLTDLVNDR